MRTILSSLLAAGALIAISIPSNAIQFAVVNPRFGNTTPQYFYDNPTQTLGVNPSPALVEFKFLVAGTPFDGTGGTVLGKMTFSGISSVAATPGPPIIQSVDNFTFKIVVDDPLYLAQAGMTLLENVGVATSADLTASASGNTADVKTDNSGGNTLAFHSDFILLAGDQAATWSYSNVIPTPITINAGNGFIDCIALGGNGNFIADTLTVPEPGSIALALSASLGGSILLMRRRRK